MNSVVFLSVVALGVSAPGAKDAPKKDSDPPLIIGSWKAEKMTVAGMDMPAPPLTLEFTDGGKLLVHKRGAPDLSAYTQDSTKKPAQLDWLMSGKKEQTLKCIYRIDADTLTICFEDGFDSARPDKFESPAGTKRMLWTFSRTAKK